MGRYCSTAWLSSCPTLARLLPRRSRTARVSEGVEDGVGFLTLRTRAEKKREEVRRRENERRERVRRVKKEKRRRDAAHRVSLSYPLQSRRS
jgi:hypothetical protein